MIKKTITYTDFDGNSRTEDFYFNLTEAEVVEMEMGTAGGLTKMMQTIVAEQDIKRIIEVFKDLIIKSYGVKSPDGKRFIKTPEVVEAFTQTNAFSQLFMELARDPDEASKFFNGIVPQNVDLTPVGSATPTSAPASTPTPTPELQAGK